MHTFEHTVEIEAPLEYVWEFNVDPENWARTNPGLRDVEIVEETDDGYLVDATYRVLGMTFDGRIDMSVVDEGEHVHSTFDSDGLSGGIDYTLRETDAGTELTERVEYEFGDSVLERLVEPVATRYNDRQFRNGLHTMAELVETEWAMESGTDDEAVPVA